MPDEMLRQNAMRLPPSDRIALAASSPDEIYPVIRWEVRAAVVIADMERLKSVTEFRALIDSGAIKALPEALQCEPWVALGARMFQLWRGPEETIGAFHRMAQYYKGPKSPLLEEVLEAARGGRSGVSQWVQLVAQRVEGPARAEVEGGATVPDVARRFGVAPGSTGFIKLQSYAAHTQGLDRVRRGEPVEEVIRSIGISQPDLVYGLQQAALTAGDDGRVLARRPRDTVFEDEEIDELHKAYAGEPGLPERHEFGECIGEVERQQGLGKKVPMLRAYKIPYHDSYSHAYRAFAALHEALPRPVRDESLVALGAHIIGMKSIDERSLAVRKFIEAAKDIEGPRSPLLGELLEAADEDRDGGGFVAREKRLCAGPARIAIEQGENVEEVARGFCISRRKSIRALERAAMEARGFAAVERGENVETVVRALRLSWPEHIAELKDVALRGPARTAVESGENVQVVAQRHSLTEPAELLALESFSVGGPALAAVADGESASAAVLRFGISDPLNVLRLAEIAVKRRERDDAVGGGAHRKAGAVANLYEALRVWVRAASQDEMRHKARGEILRAAGAFDDRLDLRDMMLREWPAGLDEAFPGLQMLYASHNRFKETPDAHALMELRHLNFSYGQLEDLPRLDGLKKLAFLDLRGNQFTEVSVVLDLPELEGLLLSKNRIRVPFDLSLCKKLQSVDMSNNKLLALPEVRDLPDLVSLLLANNDIETVPERIAELSDRLTIDLSGNPLTPETIAFLEGLDTGPRILHGQVLSREDRPPASLPEQVGIWLAARPEMPTDQRQSWQERWAGFEQEPEAGHFARLLRALVRTKEFQDSGASRKALGLRVVELLDVLAKDAPLRLQCFEAARQGLGACGDLVSLAFSNVEVAARASALAGQPDALLKLAQGQYRLALVEEIARKDVNARQGGIDEVEVILFYRVKLAGPLDLPAQPERMLFEKLAKVSDEQLAQAEKDVLARELKDPAALIASIAGQPFWQVSLETLPVCAKAIAQLYEQRDLETEQLEEPDAPVRPEAATEEERKLKASALALKYDYEISAIGRRHREGVESVHRQFTRIAMDRVAEGLPPIDAALPPPAHVIAAAKVSDIAVRLQGLVEKKEAKEAEILARQLLEPELLAALHVRPAEMGADEAEAMDTVNVQYMDLLRMLATERLLDEVAFDRLRGGDTHPTEKDAPYLLYIASRAAPELTRAAAQLITTLAETRKLGKGQDRKGMRAEMLADLRRSAQARGLDKDHKDFFTHCLTRGTKDAGKLGLPSLQSPPSGSKTLPAKGEGLADVVRQLGEVNVAAPHAKHAQAQREHDAREAALQPMKVARESIESAVRSAVNEHWAKGIADIGKALVSKPLGYLLDSDNATARTRASQSKSLSGTAPAEVIKRVRDSLLASPEGEAMLRTLADARKAYQWREHSAFEGKLQAMARAHVMPVLENAESDLHGQVLETTATLRALKVTGETERRNKEDAEGDLQTRLVQSRARETGASTGGLPGTSGEGSSAKRAQTGNQVRTTATAQGPGRATPTLPHAVPVVPVVPAASQGAGPASAGMSATESTLLLSTPHSPSGPVAGAERHPARPAPSRP